MDNFDEHMTNLVNQSVGQRAIRELMSRQSIPVKFEMDIVRIIGLISQLQLAFRHPKNTGPVRDSLEKFVRDLIKALDPEEGDVYEFLMMGFNPKFDE